MLPSAFTLDRLRTVKVTIPAKRSHADPEPSQSGERTHAYIAEIKQDEEVWLPDGDVILLPTNSLKAFRVYREILERQSRLLRIFISVNLGSARRMDDGCPVIDMPDSEHELRILLSTLILGTDLYHTTDEPATIRLRDLSALIVMGRRYGIQDLVDDGLARLKRLYPMTPDGWEDIKTRTRYVNAATSEAPYVVGLACLTNTSSLLPGALLECCMLATLVEGDVQGETGTKLLYHPTLDALAPDMRARVMAGTALLTAARATRLLAVLRAVPCEFCANEGRCALALQRTFQAIELGALREQTRVQHWFQPLHEWFWEGTEEALCGPCDASAEQVDVQMRMEDWCGLPKLFDLEVEGWPDNIHDMLAMGAS